MSKFVVCTCKATERIALIPENEITKDWKPDGQVIEADSWLEAREEVNTSGMWENPGQGWFYA